MLHNKIKSSENKERPIGILQDRWSRHRAEGPGSLERVVELIERDDTVAVCVQLVPFLH